MHLVSTGLPHHSNTVFAYTFFCPTLDFVPRKVSTYMKNSEHVSDVSFEPADTLWK
jgi:hypothetical protein